jgi:hypothetical protein
MEIDDEKEEGRAVVKMKREDGYCRDCEQITGRGKKKASLLLQS